jgi:SAM-dependent methyltransferase
MEASKIIAKHFYRHDLADLHNRCYADFVTKAAPGAIAFLRAAGIRHGVVLDLGCGGGQLSARLLREGYQPLGVDVSTAMVSLARKRVPQARFICGSIAKVVLPECSAAVAIGEVFNYLPSQAAIQHALRNAFRALNRGGILVFDIKEPLPGPEKKARSGARWGRDWAICVEVEEDPGRQKLERKIVTFRRAGKSYRRHDEVHYQVIYKAAEFVRMARTVGFTVKILPGYKNFPLSDDHKILIARKPA